MSCWTVLGITPTRNIDKIKEAYVELSNSIDKNNLNANDLNLAYNYLDEFILLKDGSIFKKDCMKNLNEEDVFECFQVDSKIIEVDNKKIIMME